MTMKPPGKTGRNQLGIALVLDKEDKEINGGYLPEFFEDWTCGEIQRRGRAFFESRVYLMAKSVLHSHTWSFL